MKSTSILLASCIFAFSNTHLAFADSVTLTPPDDSREVAKRAKESFDQGHYSDAEKLYEQILTTHPDNLYALSNLGVVRFRNGELKLAEEVFKRAITIAPDDAFSHCTLGIIYYSKGRYDPAISELTKALAIDPKNSAAKEYIRLIRDGPKPMRPQTDPQRSLL